MSRHHLTDLADVLRAGGLRVVEAPGWQSRGVSGGQGMTAVRSGIVHHTATPDSRPGIFPTWSMLVAGRDLDGDGDPDGPLSQLTVGRDGTWGVIAGGKAWHPGKVTDSRLFGADVALGVEVEDDGSGVMPPVQYAAVVKGCAVLGRHYGITWYGHKEVAAPKGRKIDPVFDMGLFRAHVKNSGNATPAPAVVTIPDPLMEGEEMLYLIRSESGATSLLIVPLGKVVGLKDARTIDGYRKAGVPVIQNYGEDYANLVDAVKGGAK